MKSSRCTRILTIVLFGVMTWSGCALRAKNVQPSTPYDFTGLQQMATYAQLAYLPDAAIHAACKPAYTEVYIQTIASTNNKYFIATSTVTRTQLMAVAGTANLENALLDADFTQQYEPGLRISLHRGFGKAARLIYDDARSHLIPGYHLQITGHSLGGAEAVILGMMYQVAGFAVDRITTFGQPKVTNQAGVDAFADLPLTRVVNQEDIVPELPVEPFRHSGPVLVLFPGTDYSLVQQRPINPVAILAAWQALQNHQSPEQLPHHYIANYLVNLSSKTTESKNIPYP